MSVLGGYLKYQEEHFIKYNLWLSNHYAVDLKLIQNNIEYDWNNFFWKESQQQKQQHSKATLLYIQAWGAL